ncbi:MAG: flagellar motor protein [Candidatus Gastranaerophilales bacterium]|nr:flagellar motor protein [Candidatus Gastranaerophilales bacterium]
MDIAALIGTFLGLGFILAGQALEGGNIGQLLQITAAFIVVGGTAGAVFLSFPIEDFKTAGHCIGVVYFGKPPKFETIIEEIIGYAQKARKEGVIILEKEAKNASHPLLKLGLEAVADGADPTLVKDMMETQLSQMQEKIAAGAKVLESAGGYSPTLGIIGAVLGLIQVMQNLSDPSKLGAGIAVAFVATIYGLVVANLFTIPYSTRAKRKYAHIFTSMELMIEGILSIQAGESPALIERKLECYIVDKKAKQQGAKA